MKFCTSSTQLRTRLHNCHRKLDIDPRLPNTAKYYSLHVRIVVRFTWGQCEKLDFACKSAEHGVTSLKTWALFREGVKPETWKGKKLTIWSAVVVYGSPRIRTSVWPGSVNFFKKSSASLVSPVENFEDTFHTVCYPVLGFGSVLENIKCINEAKINQEPICN